jgi:hypothetical protein
MIPAGVCRGFEHDRTSEMGTPTPDPIALFIAAGIVLGLAGVVLLWWGYWPRRKGNQPHCRGCDYLLLGNKSGRCPECGRELNDGNIVYGTRRRRKVIAAAGVMLLLLATLFLGDAGGKRLREIDWYHYRPAAWVVKDAGSDNAALADRAWKEIARRRSEGTIPASAEAALLEVAFRDIGSKTDKVRAERGWAELNRRQEAGTLDSAARTRRIEAALAEQAKTRELGGPLHQKMVDFLGDQYLAGRLSAAQGEQFLSRALRLDLRVRPVVVRGDPVPYLITQTVEEPAESGVVDGPGWWYATKDLGVWCDGEQVRQGSGGGSGLGLTGSSSTGSSVDVRTTGKHTLEVRQHVEIYYGKYPEGPSHLWSSRDVSLTGEFELLPEAPPAYIKLLDRPDLLPALQSCIRVEEFGFPYPDRGFQVDFDVKAPPENIAFRAFARAGGKEYELGTFAANKGTSGGYGIMSGYGPEADKLKDVKADHMDVILRSSEKVARGTVDQFEIWNGQIVIPNVKVQRPTPTTRGSTAPSVP